MKMKMKTRERRGGKQILVVRHQFCRARPEAAAEVEVEAAEGQLLGRVHVLEALLDGQTAGLGQLLVLGSDQQVCCVFLKKMAAAVGISVTRT